jgi:hypothetical protein
VVVRRFDEVAILLDHLWAGIERVEQPKPHTRKILMNQA